MMGKILFLLGFLWNNIFDIMLVEYNVINLWLLSFDSSVQLMVNFNPTTFTITSWFDWN